MLASTNAHQPPDPHPTLPTRGNETNQKRVRSAHFIRLNPIVNPFALCLSSAGPVIYIDGMSNHQKRARHGSYLIQKPGSRNWYIQLRTGSKRLERSLGTPDRAQADILAGPMITAHRFALLAAKPRLELEWVHDFEPGREHAAPDGIGKIIATDKELIYIGHNGAILKTTDNGGYAKRLINMPMGAVLVGDSTPRPYPRRGSPVINLDGLEREAAPKKNDDDQILETYLSHANVTGYYAREARAVWSVFKTLHKPLKECDRNDGRKLVAYYESQGLKSASVKKKIGWIRSAVNLAIGEGKLKFNPFAGIVPKTDDAERRRPLDDADMVTCKDKLATLADADALLFRVLATTGMRLSEAFQIDGESIEDGARFVLIGTKTDQSLRRVPLPADLLSHLPVTIKGRLFTGATNAASKRLMEFLRDDCGITDPRKVLHSLRHRAQDRLRRAACPIDIRRELLGHDTVTVGESYGVGSPVPMLKEWIDRIGF